MTTRLRDRIEPYRLYLMMEFSVALVLAVIYTTVVVYRVASAGLTPIELVLVGTVLEIAYFASQLPTGLVADLVSRRLSVIIGVSILGAAFVMEGLLPFFAGIVLAQVVRAVGFAFMSGAQEAWIADELGEDNLTHVYVRGTQCAQLGTLLGTLLSGLIASIRLDLPLIAGGVCLLALAGVLIVVMPENNFTVDEAIRGDDTPKADGRRFRQFLVAGGRTIGATVRLVRASPGLLLLLGVVAFLGTWTESFDRLWGAHFLENLTFPAVGQFDAVVWFSALSFVATLLSLGTTEIVRRKVHADGAAPLRTIRVLIWITLVIMAATAVFGMATSFWVAMVAYWVVSGLRPAYSPLLNSLTVKATDKSIRSTTLSAKDMFDATGQFVGGPAIGGVGTAFSLRTAMVAAAAALVPVCALFGGMARRWKRTGGPDAERAAAAAPAPDPDGDLQGSGR